MFDGQKMPNSIGFMVTSVDRFGWMQFLDQIRGIGFLCENGQVGTILSYLVSLFAYFETLRNKIERKCWAFIQQWCCRINPICGIYDICAIYETVNPKSPKRTFKKVAVVSLLWFCGSSLPHHGHQSLLGHTSGVSVGESFENSSGFAGCAERTSRKKWWAASKATVKIAVSLESLIGKSW